MIERVEAAGGVASAGEKFVRMPAITIKLGNMPHPIPFIRRWLGDRAIMQISLPHTFPESEEKRILDLFPETEVVVFWPGAIDMLSPGLPQPRWETHASLPPSIP